MEDNLSGEKSILPCRREVSGVVVEEIGAKAETVARETVVGAAAVLPEVEVQAEARPLSSLSVPVPVMAVLEVGEEEVMVVVVVGGDLMGAVDGVRIIGDGEEGLMGAVVVDVVAAEVGEEGEAVLIKVRRCTRE